jgi:hypothetical protein
MKNLHLAVIATTMAALSFSAETFAKEAESKDQFDQHFSDPEQINSKSFSIKNLGASRLCTLETRDNSPYAYVHSYFLDLSECRCITIKDDLKTLKPIREEVFNWRTRTRKERFFKGAKKLTHGEVKFRSMTTKQIAPENPLISEYKKQIPMFWKLKNVQELKDLISYLIQHLEYLHMQEKKQSRPILLIAIEDEEEPLEDLQRGNLELIDLTDEEKDFLTTYFRLATNQEQSYPIRMHYKSMMTQLSKIREMNYPLVTDTLSQKLANSIIENYKSVGIKEIIYTIIGVKTLHFLNKLGSAFDKVVEKKGDKLAQKLESFLD